VQYSIFSFLAIVTPPFKVCIDFTHYVPLANGVVDMTDFLVYNVILWKHGEMAELVEGARLEIV